MKILIAYISKTGTTEEIARRVGAILLERAPAVAGGLEIEVLPIADIDAARIQDYDRLILGSPINGMKVLPEFKAFVEQNIAGSGKPTDLFIVSYMFEHGRAIWHNAIRKDAEKIRVLAGAASVEIFGGRIAGPLPGFARLLFGIPAGLPLDLRDWKKIEDWARAL